MPVGDDVVVDTIIYGEDESILKTNSKYPKTEKKKMINFIKETKKIPKFNKNNILNLPIEKAVNF